MISTSLPVRLRGSVMVAVVLAAAVCFCTPAHGAQVVALYSFEEATAASFDDFGGVISPVDIHSSVTLASSGYEGQAAEFHGLGAIRLPMDISPNVMPQVTIGAWINTDALYDRAPWGQDNGGWDRGLDLRGTTWRPTSGSDWDSGIAGSIGSWQFVAVAYDGNTSTKLYVDNLTYTKTNPTSGPGLPRLGIGSFNGLTTHPFDGRIDNFFVMDGVATDAEINTIRTGGVAALQAMYTRSLRNTWDFETGDMDNWHAVAGPGDNSVFFDTNMPTVAPATGFDNLMVQGAYFIRTYEGEVHGLGDGRTGIAETTPFVLGEDARFDFLIGGGNHPFSGDPDAPPAEVTALNLERQVGPNDWEVVYTATGINANELVPRAWDASAYAGETVRLRIYDTATGGWGHIDIDDIRYSATKILPESGLWSVDMQATPGGMYGQPVATTMMGVEPAYGYGNFWNAFVLSAWDRLATNPSMALVDSNGNPTGVVFSVTGTVSGFNYAGDLEEDYLITGVPGTDATIEWTISGLDPEGWYQIYLYGNSLNGTRDFNMLVDTDGDGDLSDETPQHVSSAGFLYQFLVADRSGTIHGQMIGLGHEANWSGFQLRYIPEPSTFVLLGLGLLGLVGCGSRRGSHSRWPSQE